MSKKITMADIAEMSGVGKSTVSRYFNGGYVKESTKKKIQEVIRAQNYEPNTFARLNAKNSNVIGVVVPTLNSKITSRVITSIDRYLRGQGYETIIKNSDHDTNLELDNLKRLISLNVDGILYSAINITEAHKHLIQNSSIPVVVLAQDYDEGISVVDDDYRAGRFAGEYIGKTNPGFVGYIGVDESDIAVGINRKQGVLDGLKEYGINTPTVLAGDYSFESGQALTEKLLELGKPDAVICATDRLAFGAYRVLEQHGLRIPEDVSVMGFGGYDESTLLKPQLSTIKFDSYAVGYLGAETLLKIIRGEPVPQKQTVGFTLIEGQSVRQL
ncbi:substrate-binding domain-containing protein [Clostridium sp. MCC353]|uniref:LacI family DNA-binding transcriptional regulator n=1 Tax=Clostridium sp. MCC353 TaxID=2592646 RepID=UPI001C00A9DF|nr:LacI family DNA-binding transcriptional regulator [Clostridium sp. MCC353]MBT9778546.1 substrate-binding domain-containing protein [Clostridium sp. MCC353]